MSTEIKVLKQTELLGQQFAVYGIAEEPLFLAKDVAAWIGHTDVSTMLRMVDKDEKVRLFCKLPNTNKFVFLVDQTLTSAQTPIF